MFENPIDGESLLKMVGIQYTYKGNELSACCPFHQEKTPSFYMNKETTQFYCFGCGASGNWYSFIKNYTGQNPYTFLGIEKENINPNDILFHKALRTVKKIGNPSSKKKKDIELTIVANKLNPFDHYESKTYCISRNITLEDVNRYNMFYIKDGYIGVTRYVERLVIPIYGPNKEIIAYEGRDITKKAEKKCIYPYTSKIGSYIFDQYDLNFSKKTIFVEGIMDVIAVKKACPEYQVTTAFGIQLTPKQEEIIKQFSNEIIIFFDPDKGGEKGIQNFAKIFKERENLLSIANNPTNKDPGESTEQEIQFAISNRLNYNENRLKEEGLLQSTVVEW